MREKKQSQGERFDSPDESYYPGVRQFAVTDDTNTDESERGVQIEGLARDLARMISTAPPGQRERLRDMAVQLLRDEVELIQLVDAAPAADATVNPFAIGIPLLLVGAVMLVMFPPVGLLLFGAAALMMLWGVATVLLTRSES